MARHRVEHSKPPKAMPPSLPASSSTTSPRVLAVAAQPFPTQLLRRCAPHLGTDSFQYVASGAAALARLAQGVEIDVLLLNAILPDMTSSSFCAALVQQIADPPAVVVMTSLAALTNDSEWSVALPGLFLDFLAIPLHEVELCRRITLAAELSRYRRDLGASEREVAQLRRERSELSDELTLLQTRDQTTGLFNRIYFRQALESTLSAVAVGEPQGALAIISLDRFRHLLGHVGEAATGRLVSEIAQLLQVHFGSDAIAGRLGANELAVLQAQHSEGQTALAAEALRLAISALSTEAGDYALSASIGVAPLLVSPALGADEAMSRARRASFVARQRGGNLVHSYRPDDPELEEQRNSAHWAALIRNALANGGFRLVFQPVMRITDRTVDHYEVLIRMIGDRGQLLSPLSFIPVAERTGQIHDIDRWVVGATIGLLHRLGGVRPDLSFNINLSGRAFQDQLLLPFICKRLAETAVDPRRITFEITETAAIANIGATQEMVAQLRSLGCRFALDDFGAGFASYSYLKQLQVDVLKIDGAFIKNLATDAMDQVLVRSMVDIARRLGKDTVAEFVGDQRTLDLLAEYGVDYAQGYFIGMPSNSIRSSSAGPCIGTMQ